MIIDKELMVSNAQRISGSGATVSEEKIGLSVARNIAKGEPLYVVIVVDEEPTGTGTTVQFKVVTATGPNLTDGQVVLIETPAIAKTSLTAGRIPIVLALPPLPESGGAQQYLGIVYTTDNTMQTTGRFTAFFGVSPDTNY